MDLVSENVDALPAAEWAMTKNRAALARLLKYPLRPHAVLSPNQLAATRTQLGSAAYVEPPPVSHRVVDRRALTPEQLEAARLQLASDNQRREVDRWLEDLNPDDAR